MYINTKCADYEILLNVFFIKTTYLNSYDNTVTAKRKKMDTGTMQTFLFIYITVIIHYLHLYSDTFFLTNNTHNLINSIYTPKCR